LGRARRVCAPVRGGRAGRHFRSWRRDVRDRLPLPAVREAARGRGDRASLLPRGIRGARRVRRAGGRRDRGGAGGRLTFDALYYADRVNVINPVGDVGLITLWSPFRTVKRKLSAVLDPAEGSRVAAVANLYGD